MFLIWWIIISLSDYSVFSSAVQRQTLVSAYFVSKHLLLLTLQVTSVSRYGHYHDYVHVGLPPQAQSFLLYNLYCSNVIHRIRIGIYPSKPKPSELSFQWRGTKGGGVWGWFGGPDPSFRSYTFSFRNIALNFSNIGIWHLKCSLMVPELQFIIRRRLRNHCFTSKLIIFLPEEQPNMGPIFQ